MLARDYAKRKLDKLLASDDETLTQRADAVFASGKPDSEPDGNWHDNPVFILSEQEDEPSRVIPETDGQYRITRSGRIFSRYTRKYLKQKVRTDGYEMTYLIINGRKQTRYVHRLVAEIFLPNPDGKTDVIHKNGDKSNNHVDNLEWQTHAEVFGKVEKRGRRSVSAYTKDGELSATYASQTLASEALGISNVGINYALRGRQKTAGGFVWKYTDEVEENSTHDNK